MLHVIRVSKSFEEEIFKCVTAVEAIEKIQEETEGLNPYGFSMPYTESISSRIIQFTVEADREEDTEEIYKSPAYWTY